VGVFSLVVEMGMAAGETADAVVGYGLGQSDTATMNTYDGQATMGDDGTSGTFSVPDGPSGSWSCDFDG